MFFRLFFVWVPIFDPTLVQYFIQIPHIIFCCPLSAYDKWWFEQKKSPHFREKYLVLSYLKALRPKMTKIASRGSCLKGKLHSKIISSDMKDFFSVESNGEGPRSKFETGRRSNRRSKNGRKISGDDAARPAWVMVPDVSSSRLRPDSDQSRIWCRARPWHGCDSLNELTWVSFVVHWHLTIFSFFFFFFFFFFCRFVSVVWQDSDRVQSVTQGTWYSRRSSMLSSDSWLIDIGERSHPNPMHRSSLFQRDFQNR